MGQKGTQLLFTGKSLLLIGAIALAGAAAIGYWYVMVAGAPQLDPPKAEQHTGLTFQVQSFFSSAMGEKRRYGVVLPPGYAQHPKQRYPVIILLHGGHGNERDFEDKAKLTSVLHDLYQQRRLPSSIVVTPDGDDSGPQNSPRSFIGQLSPQLRRQLRIYLDAGTTDHRYLAATKAFHTRLTDLNIANQFHIYPGGHGIVGQNVGWNYWHRHLTNSLSYVGQQFAMSLKSISHPTPGSPSVPHLHHLNGKSQSTQTPSQTDR